MPARSPYPYVVRLNLPYNAIQLLEPIRVTRILCHCVRDGSRWPRGAAPLRRFADHFAPCFGRHVQRDAASRDLAGPFNDSAQESMQAIHGRLSDAGSYRVRQHFITHSPWAVGPVWARLRVASTSCRLESMGRALPRPAWRRVTWGQGTRGPPPESICLEKTCTSHVMHTFRRTGGRCQPAA